MNIVRGTPKVQQSPLKCRGLLAIITQPNLQTPSLDSALTTEEKLKEW